MRVCMCVDMCVCVSGSSARALPAVTHLVVGTSATIRFENDSGDGDNSFFLDGVHVSAVPGGGGATLSCEFETGDGIGGTETFVGDTTTREACVQMVHSQLPEANGVTYSSDGTRCYAEFGMTGNSGAAAWQTCLLSGNGAPPPPPLTLGLGDGEVSGYNPPVLACLAATVPQHSARIGRCTAVTGGSGTASAGQRLVSGGRRTVLLASRWCDRSIQMRE